MGFIGNVQWILCMHTYSLKAILCVVNVVTILMTIVSSFAFSSHSTVSHADEPSRPDEASRLTVRMENTYQLGVLPIR